MALVIGIDEAGYGPLLGPLVVSAVSFRVPDDRVHRNLWEVLRETVTQTPRRSDRRLAIADSKQLYHSGGSLASLERAALVLLATLGVRPKTWREFIEYVSPGIGAALDACAWYAGRDLELPVCDDLGDLATRANALARNARENDVEFVSVHSSPVMEEEFNSLVGRTRNKATALFSLVLRTLGRALATTNESRIRVCVDRLGGRVQYRDTLLTAFPGHELQVLEESPERSAYRLSGSARILRFEFLVGGEERELPIALASIYSKYLRELSMRVFNEYWSTQMDGLRPTAGYYSDAQRWLAEAEPALRRSGVTRDRLVRQR